VDIRKGVNLEAAAGGITTIAMMTVAKYIKNRITGILVGDTFDAAVAEGRAELVTKEVVETAPGLPEQPP